MPSTLEEIDDIVTLIDYMKCRGLNTKKVKTIDDARAEIRRHLDETSAKETENTQTYKVLLDACGTDARKREKLHEFYLETRDFLDELDHDFIQTLETSFQDFRSDLEKRMRNLQKKQYVVLVAGETSAGKSSVINLILGDELLPSGTLATTSTICEIKYGEKRNVQIHSENNPPVTRELIEDPTKSYREQIEHWVAIKKDRDKVSPYNKIEIFWPHPLFKAGVVIVDSPGIGESDSMDEFVVRYIPKAFAFIYVINSSNAGGIQQDRLERLLSLASKIKTDDHMDTLCNCALFVCNKWDSIPSDEAELVKKTQIQHLKKKLINLDPESQVVHLSCQNAAFEQSFGVITKDYDVLLTGIVNVIVLAMQANLDTYFRWIYDLLSHVSRHIKVLLRTAKLSRRETEKKIADVADRLEVLQRSQERNFEELSEYQCKIIENILQKLITHFFLRETRHKFCKWEANEVPKAKPTWEETKGEVLKLVSRRAHQFIQDWEDDEHEFAKAQMAVIDYCDKQFQIMEEELFQLDGKVLHDEHIQETEIQNIAHQSTTLTRVTTSWHRQGLSSAERPVFQKMKRKVRDKSKLENYKKDPFAYMAKQSGKCLRLIASHDHLFSFVNEQLEDAVLFLKKIKTRISQLRKGDEEFYQKLLNDTRDKSAIRAFYVPLDERLQSLHLKLAVFGISDVRLPEFKDKQLAWQDDEESVIGTGSFSTVYKGILVDQQGKEVSVAMKVEEDFLTCDNVQHFLAEEGALRKINHPSIVKFYGTHLLKTSAGTKVIFVFKLCKWSVRRYMQCHPDIVPARSLESANKRTVILWARKVLDALQYIHDKGFVHHNLSLDSLLLTDKNHLKLTSVRVSKYENTSPETTDSKLHLAPEVLEGGIYRAEADMYSFGFLLWELWYFDSLSDSEEPRSGPVPWKYSHPPQLWQDVIDGCLANEPENRLTANECWKHLKQLLKVEGIKSSNSGALPLSPDTQKAHHRERQQKQKRKPVPLPRSGNKNEKSECVSYTALGDDVSSQK